MVEGSNTGREGVGLRVPDMAAKAEVNAWFGREVLPLEAALMEFLQHNWRNQSDVYDFRQEVYVRVYEAALRRIPDRPKQFVFAIARNFLIDQVRRAHIVPIETATDLEALEIAVDLPGPDRVLMARDELRRLQAALDRLPPRCREVVILGRIEGLSGRQIAARMGIAEGTVSEYLSNGICALVDILYGEPPTNRRKT